MKNGELTHTAWSKSSWTDVDFIVKIVSVLSTIKNLALIGLDLILTPSFFASLSASDCLSVMIIFMSTFLLLSFANTSLNIFSFWDSSNADEVR